MAAVANVSTVNITINDIPLQVPKGEMVVESIKRLGIEVPVFCYHPRMKPVGMCRMCLIEIGFKQPDGSVRKMPKPQTACSLPASEGLVIFTDTEAIHKDRKGVLEFLLVNHPLDCPICDRGGECPLQNNTLFYGPSTSRFVEMKRHAPKAFPLSKHVKLDLERCIQCGRCVRFTEEISGDAQLAFRFRGAKMQPATFEMTDFSSKFSGNVIEICPVGALTSASYRFRARPWDLQSKPSICTLCSNGCNIFLDYRAEEVARVNGRTNEAVNEEWTCDRGKFGHYELSEAERISAPLRRSENALRPASWSEAYAEILESFPAAGSQSAVIASGALSNEDLFTLKALFHEGFGSKSLDSRLTSNLLRDSLQNTFGISPEKSTIASFEEAKGILVFGTSLADEEPILYLRVRKAWAKFGTKVIVATDSATDIDGFAHLILRYRPGTGSILAAGLALATGVPGAEPTFSPEYVSEHTGIAISDLLEAAEIIGETKSPIITTTSLMNEADGLASLATLVSVAKQHEMVFNSYGLKANDQGAEDLGFVPFGGGLNTAEILQGCVDGTIRCLWLAGVDLLSEYPDRALVERALESVETLVVQDWKRTEVTPFASLVLPMTAPVETDGTYTNLERRVQAIHAALPVRGSAKAAWRTYEELQLRIKTKKPLFNASQVFDEIAKEVPAFTGLSYADLKGEGALLSS